MRKAVLLFLSLASTRADAEVFKCIEKYGKTVYQASPCSAAAKEQQLDIKSDPAKEAEAKAKLEAIQNEYDTRKAEKAEADKKLAEQQRNAAALEIARRNAMAQQEQAQAQQRQAEALEQQNRYNSRPLYIMPSIIPTYPATPAPLPGLPRPRPTID